MNLLINKHLARFALVGLFLVATGLPATAQIYSWHDTEGRLVVSDRPLDASARQIPGTTPSTPRPSSARPAGARPMVSMSGQYDDLIDQHSANAGVRSGLVRAVIQAESAGNSSAVSRKGAQGLMQLMPATAADLGVKNSFNPTENIRGGTVYLRQLLDRYGDNEELAVAAYNAGPGAVDRYGAKVPPYTETRQYVKRVLGSTAAMRAARRTIYKSDDVIAGRSVPRYSDAKPSAGAFEVVRAR
jgi:hypothetical protein